MCCLAIPLGLHQGFGVESTGISFYRAFFLLERETMCVCVCVCVAYTQEPFGEKNWPLAYKKAHAFDLAHMRERRARRDEIFPFKGAA